MIRKYAIIKKTNKLEEGDDGNAERQNNGKTRCKRMRRIISFCKAQPVLVISFFAAVVTACIIPPDREYLGYCNRSVLIELFALMTAVGGLRSVGLFEHATKLLFRMVRNVRQLGVIFIMLCFVSSMLVTNDVALLTYVPLTLLVFQKISGAGEREKILTIVLESVAANLGSMLTPIGNPQNLYLFDFYHMGMVDFVRTLLPYGTIGFVCLLLLTLLLSPLPCNTEEQIVKPIPKVQTGGYSILFLFCLLTVFRVVPDWVCLIVAILVALVLDARLLLKVDYALLATFVCFFIFVGNISRIETVRTFFSVILNGREVLVSALLSQCISNVPAAVMLSGFTEQGTALLLGVDIGGFGTLIASMASLIAFQFYRNEEHAHAGKYMLWFSVVNFGMLLVLLGMNYIIK